MIRVANADGSVPVDTPPPTPTQQETFVPGVSGGSSSPTTRTGSEQRAGRKAPSWTIAASQRGTAIRVVLRGGSERGRIVVEALAKRADLRTKGKAKRVRVGRVSKTVGAGARVTVSVRLDAKARSALRRLGRLKLTLRVTAAGRTQSKSVTLRRSA